MGDWVEMSGHITSSLVSISSINMWLHPISGKIYVLNIYSQPPLRKHWHLLHDYGDDTNY